MRKGLPENWLQVPLGNLAHYINGRAFKPNEWECNGLPIIRIQNLTKSSEVVNYSTKIHESKYKVDNGDVLMAWSATLDVFIWNEGPAWLNQHIFNVKEFPSVVEKKFLFFALKRAISEFYSETHGTGMVHVTKPIFEAHMIPLPPLNEQKRIVAKLDAIMPRIDSAKERLEKIPAILKRFRQSVLTAAVTGKLTEKWREEHPEVESAEELLESIFKAKQALFKQNGVSKSKIVDESDMFFSTPVNWKWCRLSEITLKMSTGPFGTMLHKSDYIDNGIPVINPTNIIGEKIIASDKITISKSKYEELLRYSLKENNIVLARRGDLSKCGIVRKEQSNWLCGTGSFFLEVAISPVYFRLFYVSNYCQAPLNEDSIGSTMSNLNQSVLSNIAFPLPPLDEQKEIVRQVDKLFVLAHKVEEHYRKARARVDALAQSVLAKAFRGELVPQDPDDEPAEKLLQRIKEEKAKMETELKTVSRSARGTRKNGAKTQRAGVEEKQAGEP